MSDGWQKRLVAAFGQPRVHDLFEDTAFASIGAEYKLGAWIVRKAVEEDVGVTLNAGLHAALVRISTNYGCRSVQIKGSGRPSPWHESLQMSAGGCLCKYAYEGTTRTPLKDIEEVRSLGLFWPTSTAKLGWRKGARLSIRSSRTRTAGAVTNTRHGTLTRQYSWPRTRISCRYPSAVPGFFALRQTSEVVLWQMIWVWAPRGRSGGRIQSREDSGVACRCFPATYCS